MTDLNSFSDITRPKRKLSTRQRLEVRLSLRVQTCRGNALVNALKSFWCIVFSKSRTSSDNLRLRPPPSSEVQTIRTLFSLWSNHCTNCLFVSIFQTVHFERIRCTNERFVCDVCTMLLAICGLDRIHWNLFDFFQAEMKSKMAEAKFQEEKLRMQQKHDDTVQKVGRSIV